MNAQGRQELPTLLEKARVLPPEERAAFIDEACRGDKRLRAELVSLLAHSERLSDEENGFARAVLPFLNSDSRTDAQFDQMPAPGDDVAHFRILEEIGRGGMGFVYKARDMKLGRLVALKFLPPRLNASQAAKARFFVEARAASALDHPNICAVYDINEDEDNRIFIAMAHCEGETIQAKIARGPLPLNKALEYAEQVALGLAHAHKNGIVHRDIKPTNLIVTRDETVKIVDFGVAKLAGIAVTKTGALVGTMAYMSPDQIRGERVDRLADIWALGVVLFEMITGERPFPGEYDHAVMYAVLNEEPRPLTALRRDAPLHLTHLLNRTLAKQATKRYQNAHDVVEDLRKIRQRLHARLETGQAGWMSYSVRDGDTKRTIATDSGGAVRRDDARAAKILVVDDEPEVELLLRQRFLKRVQANEWAFAFAGNGNEALEVLASDPEIALVLTDIRMPEMDGLTLLRHLDEMDRPLKTIVISAYGDMENIRTAMNLGAFDFVTKPINMADLEATISKSWNVFEAERQAIETQRRLMSVTQEIEVARRIQEAMLPSVFPRHERVDAYAFTARARDVGGDFYDFFSIDERRLGFFVGEVASRGVSAALFSTMSQMFLKGSALHDRAPGECLSLLNRLLFPEGFPELSVSVFIGRFETDTGALSFSSAGSYAPLVFGADGDLASLEVDAQAPVWESREADYRTYEMVLRPGRKLLLFTNGITHARNTLDQRYSTERLASQLHRFDTSSAAVLIREVVRDVMQFSQNVPLTDDLTVLALRIVEEGKGG